MGIEAMHNRAGTTVGERDEAARLVRTGANIGCANTTCKNQRLTMS